nr:MAG TPA: hypothetical protein [Caudoviricetes sp.]
MKFSAMRPTALGTTLRTIRNLALRLAVGWPRR